MQFKSWLVVEHNIIFEEIFVTKIKTYKTINSNVSTRKSTCACYCSGSTYGYNISTCQQNTMDDMLDGGAGVNFYH